jgi:hypothetical protein
MKRFDPDAILGILDRCCDAYTFPMLDNGYVYPAATRLSLFRSPDDWALVIEVFGFSPRAGLPDTHIHTFASRLHDRNTPENYVSAQAFENYLADNPNNESRFIFPIVAGPWQDADEPELVAIDAREVVIRGTPRPVPARHEYQRHGIDLAEAPRVQVFELCRFLAEVVRNDLLSTSGERQISVLPGMTQILQLEEWHHPNVVDPDDRPSGSATFQQLAQVLGGGDVRAYHSSMPPNTHWRNWPDAGTL